jgi:hypothetical protein
MKSLSHSDPYGLPDDFFTEYDVPDMNHNDFEIAMIGLIDKGLVEMAVHHGVKYYRLTAGAYALEPYFVPNHKARN